MSVAKDCPRASLRPDASADAEMRLTYNPVVPMFGLLKWIRLLLWPARGCPRDASPSVAGVAGVPLGHGARLLLLPGPARLVLIGRDVETAEGKVQG